MYEKNNQIGQELPKFTPVELVGYEDEEAGSPDALASRVVHPKKCLSMDFTKRLPNGVKRTAFSEILQSTHNSLLI